jgi:hypothetical protein
MEINPFDNVIVSEPRRIEKPVKGLNDQPLTELVDQFQRLEEGEIPRTAKVGSAMFVISPEPGYGKSHLVGRLFKALQGRATLVYLRPFTNPSSCWKSILLKMVQEMEFPESAETEFCSEGDYTQLEGLAHGILKNVVIRGLEEGTITASDKAVRLEYFKRVSVLELRKNKEWSTWVSEKVSSLALRLNRQLRSAGIRLNASSASWLGVLGKYAYSPENYDTRQACLDWLRGGSVDEEQANLIHIGRADRPGAELALNDVNELCKERIMDFCFLAGFYRPFLFCFDQTETYAVDPVNAQTFGLVVQTMVDDYFNQMTVITANQVPWYRTIQPHWQDAHIHRLRQPQIELESLSKQQAEELLDHRLEGWNLPEKKVAKMVERKWLKDLFAVKSAWGVRQFLYECGKRWKALTAGPVVEEPKEEELDNLFQSYLQKVRAEPKRMVFDPDVLFWLVREVARDLPGLLVEEHKSQKGYFVLHWKGDGVNVYFGFEAGSNWSRWGAINREAKRLFDGTTTTKVLFFRTPELKEIPSPTWKSAPQLREGKAKYLHILHLDRPEMSELYASYDLHSDAAEGNIAFDRENVLTFIRKQLTPFWSRILERDPGKWGGQEKAPPESSKEGPKKKLVDEVRDIVKREKFLSLQDLMARISSPVTEDQLHKAHSCIREIKVHVSPTMTVLQWRPDA